MSSSQTRRQQKCTKSASPLHSATAEVEPDKKQNLFFTSWTNGSVWTRAFESARSCTRSQPFNAQVFYFPAMATVQVRGSESVAHVGRSSPQDLKQSVYGDASKASCLSLLMRRLDLFCQPGGRCLLLFGQAAMDA